MDAVPEDALRARMKEAGFRAERFPTCPHYWHDGPGYTVCSHCGARPEDLEALAQLHRSSDMVLVPREPTFAMLRAADERTGTGEPYRDIYRAMIAAAIRNPTP